MEINNGSVVEDSTETNKKAKRVSYSQYQMWCKCPHQWKLNYLDGLNKFDGNLFTFMGTAMHEALQTYIRVLYEQSAVDADNLDLYKIFIDEFNNQIKDPKNKDVQFTKEEYVEIASDGRDIITWFTLPANRMKLYPSKAYVIKGIEMPLNVKLHNGVEYIGYLDLVLEDVASKNIKIIDLKSSTMGWNKYVLADESKSNQLLLYKKFYSEQYNIPLGKIDIEFQIFRRKLYEDTKYSQERFQKFIPSNGKVSIQKVSTSFNNFLNECFTEDGQYNREHVFRKTPGKAKKSCKYCRFKDTEHCDSKES